MNKKLLIFSIVLFIISAIIIITLSSGGKKIMETTSTNSEWIQDNEYLYDMAVYYLTEEKENTDPNREKQFFRDFAVHHGFGIKQSGNTKNAFLWIKDQSYYVDDDGNYILNEEKSMPYAFTFVNDKITVYTVPSTGDNYEKFVRDMMPDEIEDQVLSYNDGELNMDQTVKEYYTEVLNTENTESESEE